MKTETVKECAGCFAENEDFDPGHNYGCDHLGRNVIKADGSCHEKFCSKTCYENTGERREQARLRHGWKR